MLDWDDLRYFIALADAGTLAGAARKLGVEHATVARRIAALEAKMGLRLVDRRPRRYVLTRDGQRVADHARAMEAEAFALERSLIGAQGDQVTEIAVSAPPLIARLSIAPQLARLHAAHPHLRLRLLGEPRNVSLLRREADLALRLTRPDDNALVIRKVGSMRYGLYASRAYLAAHKGKPAEFIAFDHDFDDLPQQIWLRSLAGDRPIVLRSNDLGVQAAAAAAHVGIAALPLFVATAYGLRAVDATSRHFQRDIWLTYHRDLRNNDAVKALIAFLSDCMPRETAAG